MAGLSSSIIELHRVSKYFNLPHQRTQTIKGGFINLYRRRSKKTEKQLVLKDINLTIKEGDFFGIVGRNGSGKSTLLKILAGIYQPSEGQVRVNGRIVPFIELGVGFNPELTAKENVYLNGALLGFAHADVDKKLADIIEFSELERFMDQKLKNFSSGMQVRLAFAIATRLAESDILLIDEVLAVGDADFQRKCFEYFKKLKKEKKTVVFVTHDMNAVREYCDKAMLIDKNEVVKEGSPEEIATLYSRLFQETKDAANQDVTERRWGDQSVFVKSMRVDKRKLEDKDEDLIATSVIEAKETKTDLIFGISIMNAAGARLFGTNTRLLKLPDRTMKKGDTYTVKWTIPHIFNDGTYDICPAVVSATGEVYDSWDNAASFRVYEDFGTSFPVNPKITFEIVEK